MEAGWSYDVPTILVGELMAFFMKTDGTQEKTIIKADSCYFNSSLRRIVLFLGVYSFHLFTTIFANAGQVVTGNQTPHFLSTCHPNYTALGSQSSLQYITERWVCTGNPLLVASARKSFPSKDAALSVYSAVYTVMYMTLVLSMKGTMLTKPTVCLMLLSLAVLVGVVCVAEYRNHWSDVLAGYFTGSAIAVFLVRCILGPGPMMPLPYMESPLEKLSGSQVTGGVVGGGVGGDAQVCKHRKGDMFPAASSPPSIPSHTPPSCTTAPQLSPTLSPLPSNETVD
ncbi:phospholipid phosphatase-related protein type 5-like [Megalops cyprinoides]|uniref:phospholipid phosphatase-related protein type 5-like n=1 Tax=Megalops cyprinoides TaxID=118141 RepID=UPI001864326C|nr:phospholipid phosphatase-related protein type 5-like [Megalops cyprinoides]